MPISEEELKDLIKEPNADIDKISSISSDGRNLLIRIPKEIVDFLRLNKGDRFRWLISSKTKEINVEFLNEKPKN